MPTIHNPILAGFHPDPSIVRVDSPGRKDFYIATSTFEWFPGVSIYHSQDLVDWSLVSRPLDKISQLDMRGNPSSGGVWAPCLSYDGKLFYLVFSNVRTWVGSRGSEKGFKDVHNYIVTSKKIEGPWSEPHYINSSGFDPSLFHDDGKKWFLNLLWDYRCDKKQFHGIELTEFDPQSMKLKGSSKIITEGTDIGSTEGPHLYKKGDYYYLLLAEGGTSYGHCVSVMRSKKIDGPYELHPANPILTSVKNRNTLLTQGFEESLHSCEPGLQKAGHASLCEWGDNEWILAHLCARPIEGTVYCPLGRETAIQKVVWKEDGWPWLSSKHPQAEVSFSGSEYSKSEASSFETNFTKATLDSRFMFLRYTDEAMYKVFHAEKKLRLWGRESVTSPFEQNLVAQRISSLPSRVEVDIALFDPKSFNQMAGLLIRYDEGNQLYCRISYDEKQGCRTLAILAYDRFILSMPLKNEIVLESGLVSLAADIASEKIVFSYKQSHTAWTELGASFDTYKLSDDYVEPLGFTGLFAGMACNDLTGARIPADFTRFYLNY